MMRFFLFIFFSLLFVQCNFFDSTDKIPMFIRLTDADVVTKVSEGAATHAIVDVWVFVDGQDLGVFELPIDIPVLDLNEDGTIEFSVFAGIRSNGIKSDATLYPFYDKLVFNLEFEEQAIKELDLEFKYNPQTKFEIIENFENGNVFNFDVDMDPATTIVIDSQESASGNASGRIDLPVDSGDFETSTTAYLDREDIAPGSRVFLEIDYKNDIELQIGLISVEGNLEFKNYKVLLVPKEDWNKVYIDFSNELVSQSISKYKIVFGIVNPTEEDKVVYMDNIKLLHF